MDYRYIMITIYRELKYAKAVESQVLSNTMSLCLWIINFIAAMCYCVQYVLTQLPNATVVCIPLYTGIS